MNTNNINGIQHVGLPAKDLEATIRFYESLGFRAVHRTKTPEGVPVAFLQLKTAMIEAWEEKNPVGHTGAIDHISLDVDSADEAFAEAKAQGCKMLHDCVQTLPFWKKGIRFFTIEGPDAEKIEFCQIVK
jgi:lactoylglutathione lyase